MFPVFLSFKSIHNQNPFVFPTVVLLFVIVFRYWLFKYLSTAPVNAARPTMSAAALALVNGPDPKEQNYRYSQLEVDHADPGTPSHTGEVQLTVKSRSSSPSISNSPPASTLISVAPDTPLDTFSDSIPTILTAFPTFTFSEYLLLITSYSPSSEFPAFNPKSFPNNIFYPIFLKFRPISALLGGRRITLLLWIVAFCAAFLSGLFEFYLAAAQCRVSYQYASENMALARHVMKVLSDNHVPYWLDYASLLNQLRGQTLNPWEQDVDFSLIHPEHLAAFSSFELVSPDAFQKLKLTDCPGCPLAAPLTFKQAIEIAKVAKMAEEHELAKNPLYKYVAPTMYNPFPKQPPNGLSNPKPDNHFEFIANYEMKDYKIPPLTVDAMIAMLEKNGLQVTYSNFENRNLLQCWGSHIGGPHVDLWLWTTGLPGTTFEESLVPPKTEWTTEKLPVLFTGEPGIAYNPRSFEDIFPLQTARWLDTDALLPTDPHLISHKEFTQYGGSYMVAQVFRGDCFHNFFQLRFFY